MARFFPEKKRDTENRRKKPILLLIVEGRNVTESLYFRQYQQQHAAYNIRILATGADTDPEGMLNSLERYWKEHEFDLKNGDRGFVVLDLDCNDTKGKLIEKLEQGSRIARFIVSNPCFEVWFLLHFRYSTHAYTGSSEVIRDLRRFIADYEKNRDVSGVLSGKTEAAYENAKKLARYFEENGARWPSNECNPRTDVTEILEIIRNLDGQDGNR